MLALPNQGIARSVDAHRCSLTVVADWIELSVIVSQEPVSRADVRDWLREQGVYDDQAFADEFVESVWGELESRVRGLERATPLASHGDAFSTDSSWRDWSAHTFLLVLSLGPQYSGYTKSFPGSYAAQGRLFEELVKEAAVVLFPGWDVVLTGWSPDSPVHLADVVHSLANRIGASVGEIGRWAGQAAHELGLDLVWFRPLGDARGGVPIYLVQCASGSNWATKLHTPELSIWTKLLVFPHTPGRIFCLPWALPSEEFERRCNQADAVFFDRYRILRAAACDAGWQSKELQERIVSWLEPRISWLQTVE